MAISCDPNDLAALARCFKCLPPGTLTEVQTYLLCQILNNGGTGGGVTSIIAGTNVTINPAGGTGAVTINAAGGGGVTNFTSVPATLGAVAITTQNHGLANAPKYVRAVMRCIVNDAASTYVVGDEVDCCYFMDTFNACQLFSIFANATQVGARSTLTITGNEAGVVVCTKGGGAKVHITSGNNWNLVIYAQQ